MLRMPASLTTLRFVNPKIDQDLWLKSSNRGRASHSRPVPVEREIGEVAEVEIARVVTEVPAIAVL